MGRCTNREEEGVEKREETDVATVSCRSPCRIHIQCRIEGGVVQTYCKAGSHQCKTIQWDSEKCMEHSSTMSYSI